MDTVFFAQFVDALNIIGLFAFAISGALAGIKRETDIFGVLLLSFAAACCGGIIRDLLIGSTPPDNIASLEPLVVSIAAGLLTFFFYPQIGRAHV